MDCSKQVVLEAMADVPCGALPKRTYQMSEKILLLWPPLCDAPAVQLPNQV
jgi:hypothetical protein